MYIRAGLISANEHEVLHIICVSEGKTEIQL